MMRRARAGFTLAELLITMAIISILTIFAVPNFSRGDKVLGLQRAGFQLAHDIRSVQNKAIAGDPLPDGSVPEGGYGVHFDEAKSRSFRVFADINGNMQYDLGEEMEDDQGNTDREFEEKGVLIHDLGLSSTVSVVFTPPDPETTITPLQTRAEIILRADGVIGTIPKVGVFVNQAGLVSVAQQP